MDIIDVTDFTKTLQKSVTENLAPEFKAIKTDIVKKFQESILEGNYDIAIETVGEDKVKSLNQNLVGSSTHFAQIRKFSEELKGDLASHVSKSDQLAEIGKKRTDITNSIAERQADLKKEVEQTIPGIQLQLEKEKEALLLLNVKDSAYDSQKDKVKQLEGDLESANLQVAGYIGQIEAATHFRDKELAIMEQIARTTGVSSDRATKLNQHLHKQVKLSDDNLKKNQELLEILEKQGDAKKKLVEQAQPVLEEYEGMLNNISKGIDGFFGKFPLVGGLLSAHLKKPLEEATDLAKKSLRKAFLDAAEAADKGAGSLGAMAAGTKSLVSGIAGIGKAVIGALLNPFTLVLVVVGGLLFLLKSAFGELSRLEGASKDFRMELGASAFQIAGIRDQMEQIERMSKDGSGLGLDIDKLYGALGAFSDVNAAIDHASANQVEFVARMEQTLGVSAATTTSAMANLMKLGATAHGEAEGLVMEMQTLAQKHGVKYAQVMEDVSNAGEEAMVFARGSAKALIQGAVHARRMGTSMEDVASAASKLLDFESSINSEMEASTMLGRHIDMSTLRRAALTGNTNLMLKERHRIMDSLGGLDNLNRFQQEKLAEAMGSSVEELMNMNKAREQEKMLQQAANRNEQWAIDALERRAKAKREENMSEIDKLKAMELQNKRAETMEAFQKKIGEYMYQIKTALLPIAQDIMPKVIEFMNQFVHIGDDATGEVGTLTTRGVELKDTLMGVGTAIMGIGETVLSVGGFFANFFGDSLIRNLIVIAGLFFGLKVTLGLISGLAGKLTSKLLGGGGGGATGGRGGILGSIKNFINGVKPQNILAASAALAIIAGALFVSAKAFQEFAKVNWKNAWPGILVLGGLVGAAMLLGKAGPSIIAGAVAVGLLSLSLIPLAFALNMMKDVGLESVLVIAGALLVLGFAAVKLGAIMMSGVGAVAILAGAFAIAALGASLIPLAYALKLATPGIEAFGTIVKEVFSGMVDIVTAVGGVLVNIITAIGGAVEGIIGAISTAMSTMIQDIVSLSEINPLQLIAIAAAIGTLGLALASFGVGGGVGAAVSGAGNAVGAMGNAVAGLFGADTGELNKSPLQKILDFAANSEDIALVADKVDSLLSSFDRLSDMEDILERAASSIGVFSDALASFGMGTASVGIGNAVGAAGNAIAGFFGADVPQDPIDQLLGFIEKLGSVELDTDSLEILTKLNMNGFLGGITDDFEDKIEIASDGLSDLFDAFGKVKPASIGSLERTGAGISRLFESLSQSLPKVKVADTRNLGKIAESLEDFFEAIQEINISKVASLPSVALGIKELSVGMADVSNIPLESGDILDAVGTGIDDLFYELADSDFSMMKELPKITASLKPFISEIAILPISKIPKNVDYLLSELGTGVHDFFDNLAGMNTDALKYNTHFEQIVGNMVNLAGMPEVDFTSKFTSLTNIADKLNPENVDKLKAFTEGVASAIDKFANIQDPAVQALTAISRELYMLCDVIEKLDLDKLNKLENINIGGVQTEIKIPARKLDPADPFMDGDVVEGQLKPKLMIADTPDLTESLVVESKPIELNKRQKEREVTFRRQYETVEQLTDRIKHDKDALADLKEMAIASNNLKNYEYGEKLVLEDIAVLKKIRAEFMAEQSAVDVTTPSTEEFENTPLASVFTSPPPIEPTIEAQETAIATVVAPTPSVEAITESQDTDLANFFTGPIDVKVINADELSKPTTNTNTIDNSAYTKFKTELIESMGDRSLEGYESEIKSYIETNKELIKMGAENSRTGLDLNKFSMENKFMDKLLQEIEQEKSFEAENAKMIKESQIQGELMSLQDLKNNLSSPDGMHLQSNDYAKISSTLGINATGMERDLFINDKTGKVDHQFFKNEVLKMIHERESELINYDIVDSTSTIPTVPKLEIPSDQTKQPEFILDTVPEVPSISGVDNMVQAISGTTRSVVDFGKNLLSDFFGKEPEIEDSTTNIELSGLDNISVKGHNIFVEEIAKIVNKDTPTSDSEKTEDNTKVVKKLDELILLMRRGGIQVNVDGRKVSKAVATAQDQ